MTVFYCDSLTIYSSFLKTAGTKFRRSWAAAAALIAVDSSIRSTTRLEAPSSDCTRSPDEISTIGFSTSNWPEQIFRRRSAAAAAGRRRSVQGEEGAAGFRVRVDSSIKC
ncbi:hypothetical protein F511_18839 [Dorcoceras hygrometricum]|uniref:Uncharacterized protein n=1 Tax=Dorcoceras hygrometricum TaxID=472368 RepID=A0A2Z7CAN7_9LAMI|nr:hypothetical protein F511_18839 [Dorcoceras hygrometricum]